MRSLSGRHWWRPGCHAVKLMQSLTVALTWDLEYPLRTFFSRMLLLRAATKEGAKPRVTATAAASTGHLVLFRLVDEGKADVAAYALKFIL